MSLIVALIFEPILILGVAFLLFVKRIRRYFVFTFLAVAALHLIFFLFIPVKDLNWLYSLLVRIFIDAAVLLSLGYFVRPRTSFQKTYDDGKK